MRGTVGRDDATQRDAMASESDTAKLPAAAEGDKETVVASVRLLSEDDKLVRRAAVELDTTRSEFMAQVSVQRAREVLKLQRTADSVTKPTS